MKILLILTTFIVLASFTYDALGQRRDYMTEQEIELVRDAQDIDVRIDVLTKMIDRRFAAIGINVGGWKQSEKDQQKWGDVRAGTRQELLWDVRQLLQKAIDDIDDVAMHNENTLTQNKTEGLLFPKAVRSLAAAATRYSTPLKTTLENTKDERERGLLLASIEFCSDIIEAAAKLPPETKDKKKTKS